MIAAAALAIALAGSDETFVRTALHFTSGELSRAQVALDSTNIPQREYAERVSDDVGVANTQLLALADHYRVRLDYLPSPQLGAPTTPQPAQQTSEAKARMLAGALSPRRYFAIEIAQQRAAVSLYEREARSGEAPAVRAYAQRTLGKLKYDLALAERYSREEPR